MTHRSVKEGKSVEAIECDRLFGLKELAASEAHSGVVAAASKVVAENLVQHLENNEKAEAGAVDMVHLPPHYARFDIEPIRFIVTNLGPTFLVGNIIKYCMRYPYKNKLEDCKKAQRYATMLYEYERGNEDWWK